MNAPPPPNSDKIIVICGPTATGKTALALACARFLKSIGIDTDIISADSRQVYRGMDIGTGKERDRYQSGGEAVGVWGLDLADPATPFTLADYVTAAKAAITKRLQRGCLPLLCGGTGLYIEALLKDYSIPKAAENPDFRRRLMGESTESLKAQLAKRFPEWYRRTDVSSKKRLIRALEIAESGLSPGEAAPPHPRFPVADPLILITRFPREEQWANIDRRLDERFREGMVEEVQRLIENGLSLERLTMLGMEYAHIGRWLLLHETSFETMKEALRHSIHRLSKRQATWFRGMEKRGFRTCFIDRADFTLAREKIENYLGEDTKKP